jgi:hypothetical protein
MILIFSERLQQVYQISFALCASGRIRLREQIFCICLLTHLKRLLSIWKLREFKTIFRGRYEKRAGLWVSYPFVSFSSQDKYSSFHWCLHNSQVLMFFRFNAHIFIQYILYFQAEYTKLNCFFGVMSWALDYDCFQQDCAGGRYPLLTTLNDVLAGIKIYTDVKNVTWEEILSKTEMVNVNYWFHYQLQNGQLILAPLLWNSL